MRCWLSVDQDALLRNMLCPGEQLHGQSNSVGHADHGYDCASTLPIIAETAAQTAILSADMLPCFLRRWLMDSLGRWTSNQRQLQSQAGCLETLASANDSQQTVETVVRWAPLYIDNHPDEYLNLYVHSGLLCFLECVPYQSYPMRARGMPSLAWHGV
jgi:hypothetical protein